MGEYIKIYFGTAAAAPKAVEWDKAMIVGDGSPSDLDESKVYLLTPSDWQTQLEADGFASGDQLYDSVSDFFAVSPTPQRVWVYAYIAGNSTTYTDIPLERVSGTLWEIPLKPPDGFAGNIERVKFWCCAGGTGWTYNYADGSQGMSFDVEEDLEGNWNGQLDFTNGLSGAACGVVTSLTESCKITCDFEIGSQGGIGTAIDEYGINLIALSLENNSTLKNYSDNIFGSQLTDIATMQSAISGKNCIWFYALPGDADPDDTILGTTNTWSQLRSLVGAREDIAAIKVRPSSLNPDHGVGYMAGTVVTHPHTQMTFWEPHLGISEQEPPINRGKWKDGQIACIMKRTEASGDPKVVTYGFTFGSGDYSKVEGTRCKYIIAQTVKNNLWGLLLKRKTLMSYQGCQQVRDNIQGSFSILKQQKIVDELVSIRIPIETDLRDNTAAGRIARAQQTIPAVEVDFKWYPGLEKIFITQMDNVAT